MKSHQLGDLLFTRCSMITMNGFGNVYESMRHLSGMPVFICVYNRFSMKRFFTLMKGFMYGYRLRNIEKKA
jgi:hypothetical protein